jgi:acetate kinase
MSDAILTLNAGSSSVKFALYADQPDTTDLTVLADGQVDRIGEAPHLTVREAGGNTAIDRALPKGLDFSALLQLVLDWIEAHTASLRLVAAGHRVVHGGADFAAPVLINEEILTQLAALTPLAPLHQPHNLAAIRALAKTSPELPQVACFDTGFHVTNTARATSYALPRALTDEGVRRYGFHGLSYEYIATVLPYYLGAAAEGRVVVAHLGHGASMCALKGRKSVTSTMGMTALDGLPMGERCGAIDPGVLLFLMKEKGMGYDELTELLYHRSGLLGVSGISGDMRRLLASPAPQAREAVEMFIYRIGRHLGSLTAALGGLDALIFTGGIGEHAAAVREGVCRNSAWLGIMLDAAANAEGGPRISAPGSKLPVFLIPTDEALMIARHSAAVLKRRAGGGGLTEDAAQIVDV